MLTECNPASMRFARLKGRDVVADFGGGAMTSDAGRAASGGDGSGDRPCGAVFGLFFGRSLCGFGLCTMWRCWWVSGSSGSRWATRTLWITTSCAATPFWVRFWAVWRHVGGIVSIAVLNIGCMNDETEEHAGGIDNGMALSTPGSGSGASP